MGDQGSKDAATKLAELGSVQQPNLMPQPNMTSPETKLRMVKGENPVTAGNIDTPAWMQNPEVKIIGGLYGNPYYKYLHGTSGTITGYDEKKKLFSVECHESDEQGRNHTIELSTKAFITFTEGDKVILKGREGTNNGKSGTLVGWNTRKRNRWIVAFDDADSSENIRISTRYLTKLPEIKRGDMLIIRGWAEDHAYRYLNETFGTVVGRSTNNTECWTVQDCQSTGVIQKLNIEMIVMHTKDGILIAVPRKQKEKYANKNFAATESQTYRRMPYSPF